MCIKSAVFHGLARADWVPEEDGSYVRRSFDVGMSKDLDGLEAIDEPEKPVTQEVLRSHDFKHGGWRELFSSRGAD